MDNFIVININRDTIDFEDGDEAEENDKMRMCPR